MNTISFHEQYQKINDAACKVFFDGRYADIPVYLDLEGDNLEEISNLLGKDISEIEDYICRVVSHTLITHKNNPYEWHTQNFKIWRSKGAKDQPPFIGLLIVFSLAAEHMRSEGSFSSSNYYVRLAELFEFNPGLTQATLSQAGKFTLDFWLGLNAWLRRYDNDLGVPTASAVHESWKYVSYAISQSLVRDGDKKQMHKMFRLYHLNPNQVMTSSEMSFYIDEWLNGHNAPAWLSRLWKNADLREKVSASAADELQSWKGANDDASNSDTLRFQWLATRKTFPKKKFQLYVTVNGANEINTLKLKTDSAVLEVSVDNLTGTEERYLNVGNSFSIQALLGQNIEVASSQDTHGLFMAKPILALCKVDDGNYFKEVSRVRSLRPHIILCHQAWKERVSKHLETHALKGYTAYESDESLGIPNEWICFSDVVFDGSIDASDIQDQLQQLVPFNEVPSIHALGGIKLGHGIWHGHDFPSIILPTILKNKDTVQISVSDGHSFEPQIKFEILVKDFNSKCLAEAIDLPDFGEVIVSAGSKVKELHLGIRTANNARKRMLQKLPDLSWDLREPTVFITPSDTSQLDNGIQGISNVSKLGIVDSSDTPLVNQLPELILGSIEDSNSYHPLISGGEYEAAACILRGYHYWVSASDDAESRMMICKDCSSRIIVPPPPRWKKLKDREDPIVKAKQSKLVVSEANIEKPHIDDIVDAICFKLGGSWPLLQSYLSLMADLPNDVGEFARRLSDLCIVDLKRDIQSGSVKSWVVPPPALSFDQLSNSLMLTGFRSKNLIAEITSSLSSVARYKTQYDHETSITIHLWEFLNSTVDDIHDLVSGIKDPLGRGVDVVDFVSLRILSNLPSINSVVETLPDYHVDSAAEKEYFDLLKGKWIEANTLFKSAGAYRVKNRGNMYFYVDSDGTAKRSSFDMVKLFAARTHNRYLHSYDSDKEELKCVLGADLPPLMSRSVVLSSHELPYISNGLLIYPNVPDYIGKLVISILYS